MPWTQKGSLAAADVASMVGQDALHRALTDRLDALTAVYAELKRKQLALGIILICAAVGVVCACVGFVCWWEGQASESTETPYEERTRRFQAAFGSGSGSPRAAGTGNDPFAERQRQLRQRVRILPPDDDDADDAEVAGQSTGQACESVTASESGGSADMALRQRKRGRPRSSATREQPLDPDGASVAPLDATDTAATNKMGTAVNAGLKPMSTERAAWFRWLPLSKSVPPEDTTMQAQVQEQYAQRQAYFRQQVTILPADDSDD